MQSQRPRRGSGAGLRIYANYLKTVHRKAVAGCGPAGSNPRTPPLNAGGCLCARRTAASRAEKPSRVLVGMHRTAGPQSMILLPVFLGVLPESATALPSGCCLSAARSYSPTETMSKRRALARYGDDTRIQDFSPRFTSIGHREAGICW